MELARLIESTLAIQAIAAPTFHEMPRAEYLRDAFISAGLQDVGFDEVGNLFGHVVGGDHPPAIVSAHLDTVFPLNTNLTNRQTEDCLFGPGIGDNAIALATLIELGLDLARSDCPGDVWLVANVGEEGLGNLRGMREVVSRFGDQVSAYIVLEGMALGHVYHRALPVQRFRLSASCEGGHAWIHAGRPSALHALIEVGDGLLQIPKSTGPRSSLNIGRMEGGHAINAIANHASLEVDLRSESASALDELARRLDELVKAYRDEGVNLLLEPIGRRPGGGIPSDHPLVKAAKACLREVGETQIYLEAASTDASMPLSMEIPAVCVGITRGGGAHSMHEYVELGPLVRGYQAVIRLIETTFDLDGTGYTSPGLASPPVAE